MPLRSEGAAPTKAVVVPFIRVRSALTSSAQLEGLVGAASSLRPKKKARALSPIPKLFGRSEDAAPTKAVVVPFIRVRSALTSPAPTTGFLTVLSCSSKKSYRFWPKMYAIFGKNRYDFRARLMRSVFTSSFSEFSALVARARKREKEE